MTEDRRPYVRLMRAGEHALRFDVFHRDGTQGASVDVKTISLINAAEYLLSTPIDAHAFLTLPEHTKEARNA